MLLRLRKKSLAILVGVGAVPVMYMVYFIFTAEGAFFIIYILYIKTSYLTFFFVCPSPVTATL